ncbi:septal ring lytic transglycosylase RlpA family protein [Helicobacter pametensis]|uniref:septal ring lytic transglycosylase RlpA family protein n=1 Tax=Helicobacter pametensis TaxID=95149 RepID=UPI000485ED50
MRFSYFLTLGIALVLISCSSNSVYRGGIGGFSDYEDLELYRKGTPLDPAYNESGDFVEQGGGNVDVRGMRESKAIQRATMRPYKIDGKWYYPQRVSLGERFDGIASWYGPDFHAKKTSNGEIYNMHAHTAASKILPMNTVVRVHNKENGKTTIVRINDRGPFVDGRIIDLSNAAAHEIDMVQKGTARVVVEVIGFKGVIGAKMSKPQEMTKELKKEFEIGATEESVDGGIFALQIGAFRRQEGAEELKQKFDQLKNYKTIIQVQELEDGDIYRVMIEGFRSEEEANDFLLRHPNIRRGIIIRE